MVRKASCEEELKNVFYLSAWLKTTICKQRHMGHDFVLTYSVS